MKYHLFRYLYGFEEYCRSANIQFRTIHHHEPKVKEEKKDLEESMEEAPKVDQEMPLVEVKSEPEENKRSVFIPIQKKGNAKECSNYCTIVLILHASNVILKILHARLQQ